MVKTELALPFHLAPSGQTTTGLTLTTGVWEACTKRRGASNIIIHYDVTGLPELAGAEGGGGVLKS